MEEGKEEKEEGEGEEGEDVKMAVDEFDVSSIAARLVLINS